MRAMADGRDRAGRGADAHPVGRAGRADHDPLREDAARSPSSAPRCRRAKGFNVIATANNRDRGVNELSSALRRRFNTVRAAAAGRRPTRRSRSSRAARRGARPRARAARRCAGGRRGDPPRRDDLPRAARRHDRRRPDQAQGAERRRCRTAEAISVMTNGLVAGRALRRRRGARRRPGRRHRRRRREGPGARPRRVARVPRDGRRGARRLDGPLPRLPRAAASRRRSRVFGIRHHGPGSARAVAAPRSTSSSPTSCCIEGPPEAERDRRTRRRSGMRPAGRRCSPTTPDRPEREPSFWPFAAFSPEWQALALGAAPRPPGAVHRPARRGTRWPTGRGRPARDAVRSTRWPSWPRRRATSDPERWWEDVVEHRRRATSSRRSPRRWPRSARARARPSGHEARREAHMRASDAARRGATGSSGSPSSAAPGTSPRCASAADRAADDGPAAAPAQGQGGHDLGAVDEPPPRRVQRLRRRRRAPGWYDHLFRHAGPQVIARWFCEVARRAAGRGLPGVAGAGDRRHPPGRDAGDAARAGRWPGWPRSTEAAAAVLGEGGAAPMALVQERARGRHGGRLGAGRPRRWCRWPATSRRAAPAAAEAG